MLNRLLLFLNQWAKPASHFQFDYLASSAIATDWNSLCRETLDIIHSTPDEGVREIESLLLPFYYTAHLMRLPQRADFPKVWSWMTLLAGLQVARCFPDQTRGIYRREKNLIFLAKNANRIAEHLPHTPSGLIPLEALKQAFTLLSSPPSEAIPLTTLLRHSCSQALRIGFLMGLREDPLQERLTKTTETLPLHQRFLIHSIIDSQQLHLDELLLHPLVRMARLHCLHRKNLWICLHALTQELIQIPESEWARRAFSAGEEHNRKNPNHTFYLLEEWGVAKTEQLIHLWEHIETQSRAIGKDLFASSFESSTAPPATEIEGLGPHWEERLRTAETCFSLGVIKSVRDDGNVHKIPNSIADIRTLFESRARRR